MREILIRIMLLFLALASYSAGTGVLPAQSSGPSVPSVSIPPMPKPEPSYHLPLGQTFTYGGEWRIFNAGTVTLRLEQAGTEARVVGTADATGSVAALYHVHDIFESFLDPASFCSRSISKRVEEGLRRVNTSVTFDYHRNKAVLDQKNLKKAESKHEEHDIPGCVTDVLSAIYYVGSLPLQTGKTYHFPLNDGGDPVTVDLHVEAREQIKTPAGTYYALRVHPETSSGLLKNKGNIWIWYSDDPSHIPVQMRGHMFWGTLTLTLQRVERK